MSADENVATTLAAEHELLLAEVRTRADAVLRQIAAGRQPSVELRALVDYLQIEVLRQVADEEWLLYRNAREAAADLDRLRHDHLELRLTVDRLTQAATYPGALPPGALTATVHDLLQRAATHLADEEAVLAAAAAGATTGATTGAAPPSTASLGSQPHEWYELTEGPVIDLDRLPGAPGADAAVDRLLRLRVGERVELRSSIDPSPLWRRVWQVDPAGFGVTYLHRGAPQWRVEVARRPPEGPLTPAAG